MSIVPYFKYLPTLPVLFSTALVVHWNYLYAFVQEGADLKVCDVYVAFLHVSSAFNKTVSTLQLIKEGSDVNILYFGKGTNSYYLYITKTLNSYHTGLQLNTILK